MKPRNKLFVSFCIAEAIVCCGIFLQLYSFRNSVIELLMQSAESQVNLLEIAYTKKLIQLANICTSKSVLWLKWHA